MKRCFLLAIQSVFFIWRIIYGIIHRKICINHPLYRTQVEVPEAISNEKCRFRDLTLFSADSENTKNTSADQLWFSLNQRKFQCWSALTSALAERISSESTLFSVDFLSSEIFGFQRWTALIQRWFSLNRLWYLHVQMRTINCHKVVKKWWKGINWFTKWHSNCLKKYFFAILCWITAKIQIFYNTLENSSH